MTLASAMCSHQENLEGVDKTLRFVDLFVSKKILSVTADRKMVVTQHKSNHKRLGFSSPEPFVNHSSLAFSSSAPHKSLVCVSNVKQKSE